GRIIVYLGFCFPLTFFVLFLFLWYLVTATINRV
ncbi:uncharacterized protein PgNI_08246, partial [Pyricularia grisea]|uniref:Uncharacterized protein n=1 Tax=Pyricularia grisea TaxID=148305 RepID=A0A6P8AWV1_PYRGI